MVVIWRPCAIITGMMQVRCAAPSICMVQVPQAPMPQPNLLPVRPRCSRTTHSSGASSGPSNSAGFPLTENFTDISDRLRSLWPAARIGIVRDLESTVGERHDVEPPAGGVQQGLG